MTYEQILSNILTDISTTPVKQADGSYTTPAINKGSVYYVIAVALAGCVWGLYKVREWILRQMFAVSATSENLDRHAINIGLSRQPGETDRELLNRYLIKRRLPVTTGNIDEYKLWALSVDGVKKAWVWPQEYGAGTILIDILARTEDELPSQELLNNVYIACTDPVKIPAWSGKIFVAAPDILRTKIEIDTTAGNPSAIAAAVKGYVNELDISTALTKNSLVILLFTLGIIEPVIKFDGEIKSEISASDHQIIRLRNIVINGVDYV